MWPCMEYYCHIWAGATSCYFEMFDKLQKQIYRTVGLLPAASLENLGHRGNIASLNLFYRYYFDRCSSEPAQLVPLPYFCGRSTHYSDRLNKFSVIIPRYYNTYDLDGFKS